MYLCTYMKKFILTLLCGYCLPQLNLAQTPTTHNLSAMIQDAESKHKARVGLSIMRLSDKKRLYDYNSREIFTPASVVKILSTGAALEVHNPRYRYESPLYAVGRIQADTLYGGLLLRGSGDPSMASELIEGERYRLNKELTQALKERGIKVVTGALYLDASTPTGVGPIDSWASEDLDEAYGAGLFGLNYADNRIGDRSDRSPAETLARSLEQSFRIAGIQLGKGVVHSYEGYEPEGILLYTYYSKPLRQLSTITNHRSMNLYAEGIGRIVAHQSPRGSVLTKHWQQRLGLGRNDIRLADGSGLSRDNALSPHALVMALGYLFGGVKPEDGTLIETLPRLGKEGTLRNLMPDTSIEAYLKSGTMRQVSSYAGYVHYKGDWYAIAYLSNGFPRASVSRGLFTALIEELFLS